MTEKEITQIIKENFDSKMELEKIKLLFAMATEKIEKMKSFYETELKKEIELKEYRFNKYLEKSKLKI